MLSQEWRGRRRRPCRSSSLFSSFFTRAGLPHKCRPVGGSATHQNPSTCHLT
ncbi:Rop guanine nucleotide exchange factor 14 [Zea mays]|uniref:Rop guanine nucleotide exchange factor 14 n=1 Tax=Zea mays TaxID=4577 RepID=A0A1D6HHG4_MAIZE|nr:Rop guanine nucleotide exchange factor 14 [Zea mays]